MSLPLHLVPDLTGVERGAAVLVEGDEAHHAVAVRRLRPGEPVELTDGRGRLLTGVVRATGRRELTVEAQDVAEVAEPQPRLTVVQALPKGDRGELAVELLTEIGVARIVPWAAERSVASWRGERATKGVARWRATAREAAKQARRPWFPEVTGPVTSGSLPAVLAAADLVLVLHESAPSALPDVRLPEDVVAGVQPFEIALVVGPEGGLTDAEVVLAGPASVAVHLGREILRTSTAGVAACAALLARTSRWA